MVGRQSGIGDRNAAQRLHADELHQGTSLRLSIAKSFPAVLPVQEPPAVSSGHLHDNEFPAEKGATGRAGIVHAGAALDTLAKIRLRAYLSASKYISRTALIQWRLEGADQPFTCLMVDNSTLTNYLLSRGHLSRARVIKRSKVFLPCLRSYFHAIRNHIDLCIAVMPKPHGRLFPDGLSFKTRESVRQVLDLDGTQESLRRMNYRSKKVRKLIRANGFSSRISFQQKDFDFFYHQLYLPHLLKQHGPYASIDGYEDMRSYFHKGFLMMVGMGDRTVSAQLCFVQESTLILRRMGVLEGEEDYVRKGAQSAVYYFMLQYARDNGLKRIDFMNSRPFFKDGVYIHKLRWGACLHPADESESWVHFLIPRLSPKIALFFQDNPVIIHTPQGFGALVGRSGTEEISPEEERGLKKQYRAPGLSHLLLLTPDREAIRTFPLSDP